MAQVMTLSMAENVGKSHLIASGIEYRLFPEESKL